MRIGLFFIISCIAGAGALGGCAYENHYMGADAEPATKQVIIVEEQQRAPVIEKHIINRY